MLLLVVLVVAASGSFVAGAADQLVAGLVHAAERFVAILVRVVAENFALRFGFVLAVTVAQMLVAVQLIHVVGYLG